MPPFGLFVSHTALAIGANVIERHFTLDRTFEGPDHILSSEPSEFRELVAIASKIPVILGDGVKRIQPKGQPDVLAQTRTRSQRCVLVSRKMDHFTASKFSQPSEWGDGG